MAPLTPHAATALLAGAGLPARTVVALGEGTDHISYLVDGQVVARFAHDRGSVEREARLLGVVAAISPIAVPEPLLVLPEVGCLAYRRLPGVPLLEAGDPHRHAEAIGVVLGGLLAALHATPPERLEGLVEPDELAPREWQAEAAGHYASVRELVPPEHRPAIDAFLSAPAPAAPPNLVFSHNDLGIEHVLVEPGTATVTGIIDWSDAALVDPARDFGLICRDLGPAALDAALDAYGQAPTLRDGALFHARCALFEDLAYGGVYTQKSLAGLASLFAS